MADPRTSNLNLYEIGSASDNVGVHMITHYNFNMSQLDSWIAAHDVASFVLSNGVLTLTSTDGTTKTGDLNGVLGSVVASAFDSSASYAVDDLCIYQGVLYRCTTAHSGAWDAGHFSATTIAAELGGGHIIQDPTGTDMTQRENLQFTGNVTVTDDSGNDRTIVNVTDSGHTILDNSGNPLTQRSNLQFNGVYSADDGSTTTEVNIVRDMTKAQMEALSATELVGFIHTTDEPDNPYSSIPASGVSYDNASSGLSANDVQDAIDEVQTEIGNTDISAIGDGTVSGAISTVNSNITTLQNKFFTQAIPLTSSGARVIGYPAGISMATHIISSISVNDNTGRNVPSYLMKDDNNCDVVMTSAGLYVNPSGSYVISGATLYVTYMKL